MSIASIWSGVAGADRLRSSCRRSGSSPSRCARSGVSERMWRTTGAPSPASDVEDQPVLGDRQMQRCKARRRGRPARTVLLDQIVDRDRALVLDVGARAADRILVERHRDEPARLRRLRSFGRGSSAVEPDRDRAGVGVEALRPRRARSRPGRARASCSGPHLRIEVRFMKSSTPSPDEKRAERAVGSTWLEPADVIADRLGRVRAEEDRAGIADAARRAARRRRPRSRDARARSRRRAGPRRRASRPE